MEAGLTPEQVLRRIVHHAYVGGDSRQRKQVLEYMAETQSHNGDIVSYNKKLRDLCDGLAKAFLKTSTFRDLREGSRHLVEFEVYSASLRSAPNYQALSLSMPAEGTWEWKVWSAALALMATVQSLQLKLHGLTSLGDEDFRAAIQGERITRLLKPGQDYVRRHSVVRVLGLAFVGFGWLVILRAIYHWTVPAGLLPQILFWALIVGGISYFIIDRIDRVPSNESMALHKRRLGWRMQQYPILRWFMITCAFSLVLLFCGWVGLRVLPQWIGPYVYGGAFTVRLAIGAFGIAILAWLLVTIPTLEESSVKSNLRYTIFVTYRGANAIS